MKNEVTSGSIVVTQSGEFSAGQYVVQVLVGLKVKGQVGNWKHGKRAHEKNQDCIYSLPNNR